MESCRPTGIQINQQDDGFALMLLRALFFVVAFTLGCSSHAQRPNPLSLSPSSLIITAGSWMLQNNVRVYQVDVQSTATTFDVAKQEAFRLAVEQAVGTLMLSETEMQNGSITRRDVINYASGYVDKFEVISRTDSSNDVTANFRIWVSHSQIANRLLTQSKDNGTFDGQQASAQIGTLLRERADGDNALAIVLKDFPKRAFNIKQGKHELKFDENRNAVLVVNFLMTWSYQYLMSLGEILQKTSQKPMGFWEYFYKSFIACVGENNNNMEYCHIQFERSQVNAKAYINMRVQEPDKFFFSKNSYSFGFGDIEKVNQVKQAIRDRPFSVQITISDKSNQTISRGCYKWNEFVSLIYPYYETTVYIDGFYVLNGLTSINFGQRLTALESISNIDIAVLLDSECKT